MTRTFILLLAFSCAACSNPPAVEQGYLVRDHDDAQERSLRALKPGFQTPIIADDVEVGAVRRYIVDQEGRIIAVTPTDPRLEPADAPDGGRIV